MAAPKISKNKNLVLFSAIAITVSFMALLAHSGSIGRAAGALDTGVEQCTDSDGGKNYFVKGITSGASSSDPRYLILPFVDACTDADFLTEYYCSGIFVTSERHACSDTPSYVCKDGACIFGISGNRCIDSDGGKNPIDAGTCTDHYSCKAGCKDACAGTSAVQEYYCESGRCHTAPYGCSTECKKAGHVSGSCAVNEKGEGYCKCDKPEPECNDTDADEKSLSGNNPFRGGVCTSADGQKNKDSCNGSELTEYFCKGGITCAKASANCHIVCWLNPNGPYGECKTDGKGLGYCKCSATKP